MRSSSTAPSRRAASKIHSDVTATLRIEIAATPKFEQAADEEAGSRKPRRKSAEAAESTEA